MTFIGIELNLWVFKVPSSSISCGRTLAVSLSEVELKLVPIVSIHYLHSPVHIRLAYFVFPSVVYCVWGPHGHRPYVF